MTINSENANFEPSAREKVPFLFSWKYNLIPFRHLSQNMVSIALTTEQL